MSILNYSLFFTYLVEYFGL